MHPRAAAQGGVSSVRRPFSRTTPPALRNGIPMRSPPASTPPAPSQEDTHTLLLAAPPRPVPSQEDTRIPRRHPPPHPRLRRSSPAPGGGGIRARAYIRGAAVSGVEPVGYRARGGAGISPCAGPWWISPRGERLTGRGNLFPLPCLPHSNHLTSRRHPLPAPAAKDTRTLLPASPPPSRRKRAVPGRIPDRYRRQGSGPTGPPAGLPFSPGARILP